MKSTEINTGIIYTKDSCIGCNKCISSCIAVGANVVVKDNVTNEYQVLVDPTKCVLCGHCVEECVHKARVYRDDTDAFFEALAQGEAISILVAPSLLTTYESRYEQILGYLKHLGVRHIYNCSFGADIMVWVYMNFIHDFGLSGVISQFCPVIVNYLEKYKPELLDHLMPVQSPMMCTAIYVSDYLEITDKLAYISPCIAQKYEIEDVNTYGKVSYNVTFERLLERLESLDLEPYHAQDEVSYGLGALVSSAGGLSDNIKPYIGFNKVLIQTSGYRNIFPYFDHYSQEFSGSGELPFLVDVLSCTNGCDFGTGTHCGVEQRNLITFSAHRVKENAYASGNVPVALNYEDRLTHLNKRFEHFQTSSFVRQYSRVSQVPQSQLSEEALNEVYHSLFKDTDEQRRMDCGACGYRTCRDMAHAIGWNINHKENCINYSKYRIRLETEKTTKLLSEISEMNEELKRSAQLKSNFLANMSHEIRTPMNSVIGMAEMALRGNLPNEERGYIQQIKTSGRSLLAIINDILDFSKIESGKMELNECDYVVMSIINDTVSLLMSRINDKDITLIVDADPAIPFKLHGDDIRIKQVLVNLATNAVKFTSSGFVGVSLGQERRADGLLWLTASVRDSGIGIKQESLKKLFTSFQQVDSKRNRNIEGTGLGLAISREFVKLMNGEISVKSVYGRGSVFSFAIPQAVTEDLPSVSLREGRTMYTASLFANVYVREGFLLGISKLDVQNTECFSLSDLENAVKNRVEFLFLEYSLWDAPTDALIKSLKETSVIVVTDPRKDIVTAPYVRRLNQPLYSLNIASVLNHEAPEQFGMQARTEDFRFEAPDARVLIVDDNTINLTVARGLLSPLCMDLSVATGALEAISMLTSTQYDIVLMDHMMPDIDGIEATHMIREMGGEYEHLPIIALTANAINNAREMFLREGMDDFISKPIEIVDLVSKIRKWLPPEKIKNISRKADPAAPAPTDEFQIEGLDTQAGLTMSGSPELYRKILAIYHASLEKKAGLIEQYCAAGDLKNYTIEVHALKSASKIIGAMELSDLAARLEKCGHDNDADAIYALTPSLLTLYRSYLPRLAPFSAEEPGADQEPCEIAPEALEERLTGIYDALEDFNINLANDLFTEFRHAALPEEQAELREQLQDALDSLEYDEAADVVTAWRALLPTGQSVEETR